MFKKYKIIKWTLTLIVSVIMILILFGVWVMSFLPPEDEGLKDSQVANLDYVIKDVPSFRGKILAVVTSTDQMGTSGKLTGYELTELARAYYVFKANGFEVDVASPLGGQPPMVIDDDDMGVFDYAFLNDPIAQQKITYSLALQDVDFEVYEAVYFVGGKGAMYDFPDNKYIQALIQDYHAKNKVIGAVCHGPAALVNVILDNGEAFLKNKTVSGFTNEEELLLLSEAASIFPFLLQDKLIEQGANFNEGTMYLEQISQDGKLVTGQNPWSVWALSEAMIKQLGYTPKQRKLTSEEHTVQVLYTYKTKGLEQASDLIKELSANKQQPLSRALLIDHSMVAIIQVDFGTYKDIMSLVSYAKELDQ